MTTKQINKPVSAEDTFKPFFDSFPRYGHTLCDDWEKEILRLARKLAKKTAKFYVEEALKVAATNAKVKDVKVPYEGARAGGHHVVKRVDEDSIINAYKIK